MERERARIAGGLIILGVAWTAFAVLLAQSLMVNYSWAGNALSGIGSSFFGTFACAFEHCNDINQPSSLLLLSVFLLNGIVLLAAAQLLQQTFSRVTLRLIRVCALSLLLLFISYIPLYLNPSGVSFAIAIALHASAAFIMVVTGAALAIIADVFRTSHARLLSRAAGVVMFVCIPLYTYLFITNSLWRIGFGGVERVGIFLLFMWFFAYAIALLRTPVA